MNNQFSNLYYDYCFGKAVAGFVDKHDKVTYLDWCHVCQGYHDHTFALTTACSNVNVYAKDFADYDIDLTP